jgi:hypothetical protein
VTAWVEAIESIVDDPAAQQAIADNLVAVREELAWPRLAERVGDIAEAPRVGRVARPRAARDLWTLWHGGGLAARGAARNVFDALRPFQRPPVP